ncbi:hypothetical protein DK37_11935 [Halomonas sp. SUBG004]|nr:hypothetical protein DK37_11935 [Halomonas sp. SUBG004]
MLWTGYANDITQRKALEAALKSSEQRFRQLVEQANDIIYTLDADGMLTYISPNWPRILGARGERGARAAYELRSASGGLRGVPSLYRKTCL